MTAQEKKDAVGRALEADERAEIRILFTRLNAAFLDVEFIATQLAMKVPDRFKGYFRDLAEKEKQHREQVAMQKSEVAP